ncbi:alpha/beta fold hydrolase [Ekhidna sp. To15]|uniref:alpha/beta fold hydrolase n=1 Tax=Ekhidna sp. To15 TaxID=3395267 RepID=UPI003F51EA30
MKKTVFFILILSACEFRMEDSEAKESLESIEIRFENLLVGSRNMHYAYIDQQKDTMIAFIHGSPGSWSAFIDFFKADTLLKQFDIISVDRPGFGESGFGEAEPSIEMQAFLINEVLNQFPKKHKILIGHSLGGPVVARMAMDYPDTYLGMILVAPSIDPEMEEDEWYRKVIDTQVGAFFTPKEFEASNDEIMPLKKELSEMVPLWDKIKIPTIVIQGTEDSLVPKENAAFAQKMLPDSLLEIYMLEDVNHFIPWTHPEEIIKAIHSLADGHVYYP